MTDDVRTTDRISYDEEHTPVFTHEEVTELVATLPASTLAVLAQGPIEREKACRACDALEPLLPVHPSEPPEAAGEVAFAAYQLKRWHDNLGVSEHFAEIVTRRIVPVREYQRVEDEVFSLTGQIMYARCSTLYAMAGLELAFRAAKLRGEA